MEELASFGGEDFDLVLPTEPINSVFGFGRSLVETPRSATIIGSGMIDEIGIRDGDQLSRIVPGTYTVNRWGIAGATNVRGNNADVYLRGMKRIDPQGNIRNVITMWDSVEVVRGPPSPIFGNGRIGGYVNYVPKSVRGTTGKYLDREKASISVIAGSYSRLEFQLNYAAPLNIKGHEAGFQVFVQGNDSDSYYDLNFQRDRVLQASFSMNLNDTWHLEAGGIYQKAVNAGQAGANRVTQDTFDNGTYLRGTALVNLDTDGNGRVSEAEIQASRYYPDGTYFSGARPMRINFALPTGKVPGVPKALKDLLMLPEYAAAANSAAGQAILASPTGGPLQTDGSQVPIAFFLNPAEVGYGERDWSKVAIEEEANGHTYTFYTDIIDDADPTRTQKLQFLYDYQYQDKRSQLPFNQIQEITALETKYTITRRKQHIPFLQDLPDWIDFDLLASANVRYTDGGRNSTSGDYDHRRDLLNGYTPTDTMASFLVSDDRSFETGEPISGALFSEFVETGAAGLIDMTIADRIGVLGGLRYDYIDAQSDEGERFNRFGSSSATGGTLAARSASGHDDAVSYSASVSYSAPFNITPYVTISESSAVLSGSDQSIAYNNVVSGNILGAAELWEWGVKGTALKDKLYYSVARYGQKRSSSVEEEGASFIRSTNTHGWELEMRYQPDRHWSFVLSGTWMDIMRYQTGSGTRTAWASAEYIGFEDVLDANGNVVFPANAFLFGGNANVVIPDSDPAYLKWGQYPDEVYGFFVGYHSDYGWGATWNATYISEVAASSELPDLLVLPSTISHAASIYWKNDRWRVSLNVRNALDEEYFTPNTGSFGGGLLQPVPPRNYELSVTRWF